MQIADLFFSIQAEGIDKVSQQISNLGNTIGDIGSSLTDNISKPILNFFAEGVEVASDINEAMNVVSVTFGKSGNQVIEWSGNLIDSFGLTKKEALGYVGSMGAMLKSSGLTASASKNMSKELVKLTGDMSSFYNLEHDETWEKIRSGISGETEPLKALGINMSVANLEAYALSQGINKAWTEMSQAEQVTLRYNYLMKVTKDSQGDFARTQDGFANKWRTVKGRVEEFAASIGEVLLPYIEKAIIFFDNLIQSVTKMFPNLNQGVIIFGLLAAAIGPILIVIGGLIVAFGGVVGAISAVIALISAIGLPVFAAVAASVAYLGVILGIATAAFTAIGGAITIVGIKTGIFKAIFESVHAVIMSIVSVFKGDLNTALDLLVNKFGLTKEQAQIFINKVVALKTSLINMKNAIQDVITLLGAIFSADKQEIINTLIEKFGLSKKEAEKFANEVLKLKDQIVILGNKIKDKVIVAVGLFIDFIKRATDFVVNHKEEILLVISTMIKFATVVVNYAIKIMNAFSRIASGVKTALTIAKSAFNAFKTVVSIVMSYVASQVKSKIAVVKSIFNSLKSTASTVFSNIKSKVDSIVGAFNRVVTAVKSVISKISQIKMPKLSFPKLPMFADGVRNFSGGWALVGEEGPELMELPKGSNIYSNDKTRTMLNNVKPTGNNSTQIKQSESVNLYGDIVIDAQSVKDFTDIVSLLKGVKREKAMRT